MTDQTIAVPVDLLKSLKENYPVLASGNGAIAQIAALIPNPPKVGATLSADQIKGLPRRAVVRDKDGDLWIADGSGHVSLIGFNGDGRIRNDGGDAYELEEYYPVLAYLPEA